MWVPEVHYLNATSFSLLVISVFHTLHASFPLSEKGYSEPNVKMTSMLVRLPKIQRNSPKHYN